MHRLVVDPRAPDPAVLARAAAVLAAGGVVAFPTDTLYGLAADPRSEGAVQRLFAVKRRPDDRPVPLIAADVDQVAAVGVPGPLARRLAASWWPGPLTLLVPARSVVAPSVLRGAAAVGVRVPDHAVARGLAAACGFAITATSANRSGEPGTADPGEVARTLGEGLDLLLDAGPSPGGPASTIVDATGTEPVLVRAGAIAWERVIESLAHDRFRSPGDA